jgi:hypothetical protein
MARPVSFNASRSSDVQFLKALARALAELSHNPCNVRRNQLCGQNEPSKLSRLDFNISRSEIAVKSLICASAMILAGASSLTAREQKVSCDAIPAAVRAAFEKAYAKATINDCAKDVEKGRTTYEISSTEGETRRDIRFYVVAG